MPLPPGLRALDHRDFRLFWGGQLVSLVGTWMQSVGQAWLVLELTNSPFLLGLIATLQFLPILLFSSLGGVVADRVRKRRLILVTQSTLMIQAFILSGLSWSGHVRYWHVAVLACLYGLANALDMPTRQSFIVDLAGKEDLMSAIALNSASFNGARVVGPAVAGFLVARYGPGLAFFLNGASFLAVIAALLAVRAKGIPRPRAATTVLQEIAEGAQFAAGTPRIALIFGLLAAVSLFVINYNVLVPLIARDVLHQGAHGFGLLMGSLGGGAVCGALALAALGLQRPPLPIVVGSAIGVSAATAALAAVPSFPVTASLLAVIGAAQILFTSGCNTTVQLLAPDQVRGRVMGLYALVFVGVTPAGAFLVGLVAEHLGVRTACAAGGIAGLLSVIILTAVWRGRVRR